MASMLFLQLPKEDRMMTPTAHTPAAVRAHSTPDPEVPPPTPEKDPPPDDMPMPEHAPIEEPTPPRAPVKTR
jgi:hypothetical protein